MDVEIRNIIRIKPKDFDMPIKSIYLPLAASLILLMAGCATDGISTNTSDFQGKLASGNIRLTCGLSCAGTVGATRAKMKGQYTNRLWMDLAKEVAGIGYDNDLQYYYLAISAANLGYRNAARTYISLANATAIKCGGSVNVCDGFVFPRETNALLTAINNADAKDAAARDAAARDAAARDAAARQQRQTQQQQQQQSQPQVTPNTRPEGQKPKASSLLGI